MALFDPFPSLCACANRFHLSHTLSNVHSSSRRIVTGPVGASDVVVSERELAKIQKGAIMRSEQQIRDDREMAAARKREKQQTSNA